MRFPLGVLLFTSTGLVLGVAARAADASDASAAPAASANATAAAPAVPTGFWERSNLIPDYDGWRSGLNDSGWSPFANLTAEIWGNSRGGIRSGMTQDMLLAFGTEADFEKIAGLTGSSFRVSVNWIQGQRINSNVGAFNPPTTLDASNSVRVYNLYLRQKLFSDQVLVKAGQVGADDDFFQIPAANLFLNAGFTAPPTLFSQRLANGDLSVPQYPADAPGVVVKYTPANWPVSVYSTDAVIMSDPGPDSSNNHGFDWRGSNSVIFLKEMGWNYKLGGRAGTLAAGGYYNDGQFTNWSSGSTKRGIYGAYAFVNQVILQNPGDNGGDPQPVLTAFAGGGWSGPDSRVSAAWTGLAGVNWNGPIPGRDNDVAGVAVLYTGLSPSLTRATGGVVTASETVLEFTYQAAITPWFSVQPDVQVIFNPAASITRSTAVVIGARATIAF